MNRELIEQFRILQQSFSEKGDKGRTIAYGKIVGALQALDKKITKISDVKGIRGIGPKALAKIKEYLDTGEIEAVQQAKKELKKEKKQTEEEKVIDTFVKVWGIGPSKAQKLYSDGMRSIADLHKNTDLLTSAQRIGLKYYDDLLKPVPRMTITTIFVAMQVYLKKKYGDSGYAVEVAGSYRRGAKQSGDMDVLITSDKFTLKDVVKRFQKKNIITDVLSVKDTKFMGIAQCPSGGQHFRLDIEFVDKKSWGTALLYFTGSKTFNVHMRAKAKRMGLLLNEHGLYDIKTGDRVLNCPTEECVFAYLEMKYIAPENR